jgi:MFS family permease
VRADDGASPLWNTALMTDTVEAEAAEPSWLTPGVAGIGSASLLADLGHEIPTSLLPSLLTSTLGAPAAALGLVEGIADAVAGACRFAGGALADDPHRRRTVAVGGYTATAVLSALVGAAHNVWQVGVLRTSAWAARGLRVPARNALLADVVPRAVYGRAYGFERAMDNLGAIGGPLLALALVAAFGTRTAIAVSVIPGLAAAAAITYAVRHTARPTRQHRQPVRLQIRAVLRGDLGMAMVGISTFEMGNCAATLLILRATQLLAIDRGTDTAAQVALLLYAGYNTAATVASIPAGRLADRAGNIGVLAVGVALFLAAYLTFAATGPHVALLALAFVVAGVAIGCVETAEHAAVATLAPTEVRGSAFGLLAGIQSFGNLAASSIAGIVWTLATPTIAFVYLAAWMVLSLTALAALRPTQRLA